MTSKRPTHVKENEQSDKTTARIRALKLILKFAVTVIGIIALVYLFPSIIAFIRSLIP